MTGSAPTRLMDFFEFIEALPHARITDEIQAVIKQSEPTSALRSHLGQRDDFGFAEQVVSALVDLGLEPDDAAGVATTVILTPTVVAKSGQRVAQSVIIAPLEGHEVLGFPTRVTLRATLHSAGRVKSVIDVKVDIRMVDLESSDDVLSLAVELAEMACSYPAPGPGSPVFTCVILGKPTKDMSSDLDVPWNSLLDGLAVAFRVKFTIITDQSRIKDPFPAAAKLVLALDPSFVGIAQKVGKSPTPPVIASAGVSTSSLLMDIARAVQDKRSELDSEQIERRSRNLMPGESVFHRKVGTSAAFDRFGDARKPCQHGAEKYKRYYAAPKAEKGMARLYDNFDASMLYHCGRGYGCGMYAVFAPSNF